MMDTDAIKRAYKPMHPEEVTPPRLIELAKILDGMIAARKQEGSKP